MEIPFVAPYQVIIVPVIKKAEDEEKVMAYIEALTGELKNQTAFGEKIRIKVKVLCFGMEIIFLT